ncbi:equilibrative nucleoside transporter 1-like [Oppia nitens]|uniref:equilibrative nucleoside transporter 1-like n=1 Tax=Oppia nitens TaxID=1686743 RepID=UPI0023DA4708|nr:equilibrative nucleoside transporter 1-like [Oppia nitens]
MAAVLAAADKESDEYTRLVRPAANDDNYVVDDDADDDDNEDMVTDSSSMEPFDRLSIVKISFGLIGLSQLIPWNFLITASDYWSYKFRDTNATNGSHYYQTAITDDGQPSPAHQLTPLQKYFESYLAIATNVPFLVVLAINAFYGHKISDAIKNMGSFVTIILIFILTTIFVKIDTDYYQQTFFGITIATIVLLSTAAAFLQSSLSGIASLFPALCMQSMISGQAMSGLFAAAAQILALMGGWDASTTALYYFIMADLTLIVSLVLYLYSKKTDYYRYHKHRVNQSRRQLTTFVSASDQSFYRSIIYSIWPHLTSAMLVFWVTLSVFPAITVLVVPESPNSSQWTGTYFIPVTCFLLFNLSDLMGRFAGRFCPIPAYRRWTLLLVSAGRIVLIPLLMLCNVHPRAGHLPVVFLNEMYYIWFVTALGFSNGYVLMNVMVSGPTFVANEYKESAGFFLVSFIGLGLTLGSFTSNILLRLL